MAIHIFSSLMILSICNVAKIAYMNDNIIVYFCKKYNLIYKYNSIFRQRY